LRGRRALRERNVRELGFGATRIRLELDLVGDVVAAMLPG